MSSIHSLSPVSRGREPGEFSVCGGHSHQGTRSGRDWRLATATGLDGGTSPGLGPNAIRILLCIWPASSILAGMSQDSKPSLQQHLTGAPFPTTQWSQVLALRDVSRREAILNVLCQVYWRPLYTFLRHHSESAADAKDIVQGFLARIVERDAFDALNPAKGR